MAKIIGPGSCMVDITGYASHLPSDGETAVGDLVRTSPGGKGSNQMIAAHRAGSEVFLIACIGDDSAASVLNDLYRENKMSTKYIRVCQGENTGTALIQINKTDAQNRILIIRGANLSLSDEDVKKASKLIRWHGFKLGHQMMVGLPESTRIDEINTAKELIKLKPKMVRIYPVLVIKNTQLEKEYLEGKYKPLTVVQAVEICKELVAMFNKKNIEIIRIGLQNTDTITSPNEENSEVVAGPYHPAFRQLVESGLWYDTILSKIKQLNVKVKKVEVTVNPQDANNVIGHKRENIEKLKEMYTVELIVKQDENIKQGKMEMKVLEKYPEFLEDYK